MTRYLYIEIMDNRPMQIKHFYDRSAGLKHIAEQANLGPVLPEAYWDDALKRARVGSNGSMYWLYEVEIF